MLKMAGSGNGTTSLISEYVVNRIASQAGLPVPDSFVVYIPTEFPWDYGTDEFYDIVRKSSGPNLGLTWLPSVSPIPVIDYPHLPSDFISQVVTIDLSFVNVDRSAESANLLHDQRGFRWIVDHGSCRSLFRDNNSLNRRLPANHAFVGRENSFDQTWFRSITKSDILSIVGELPNSWLMEAHTTRQQIVERIALCGWGV